MGTEMRTWWCVVPAAGRGHRFSAEQPRQYCLLAGRPLLEQTLRRLAAQRAVAGLMVVLAPDDTRWAEAFPEQKGTGVMTRGELLGKPLWSTAGGATRAASTLAGLGALPPTVAANDFVLIHDAARPCVRSEDVARLIATATQGDGGLLAAPLRDTLKRGDAAGHSLGTESRGGRWRAMTPQVFRRGDLAAALTAAYREGIEVTDEAMAMEHAGFAPQLVEGAADNVKVTTGADLALAEFLLLRNA